MGWGGVPTVAHKYTKIHKNTKKIKKTLKFDWDPTGESTTRNIRFDFDSSDFASVNCTKYKKSLKIENNWIDSLQIVIAKKE